MTKDVDLTLTPEEAFEEKKTIRRAADKAGVNPSKVTGVKFLRKSIDARRVDVKINARVRLFVGESPKDIWTHTSFQDVSDRPQAVVVGSGPAGLFAALTLIEHGVRPIVLERGKDVHERKVDCANLAKAGILNEDSNYCYGEGGAGAYSDGKLYTRSVKRGDVGKVLSLFIQHGADEAIISDVHPHLGTDKLPSIIENIRHTILASGGEVHFSTKVTGLLGSKEKITGVKTEDGREFLGPVILAAGHSAKDVYRFLDSMGLALEAKDTAVGVRLEHPQQMIDVLQYHNPKGRGLYLPPASYSFVTQVDGRGVYSFCMCPGGSVVPAATEHGLQVVNGMSSSSRGGKKANAAMVVQIRQSDIPQKGVFGMLEWVEEMERASYLPGYKAPGQRMVDFMNKKMSFTLPQTTYAPGLESYDLHHVLPEVVATSLQRGFQDFDRMTRGRFATNEAVMIASETRTSSPVRILRGDDMMQVPGLYPAGEGAGYAGGIVSAAIDGTEAAKKVAEALLS
ncbi:MAG: NAD(P)/FAD-dependent oxidoreductase [Spirochaetales bacterium]|nr:NAD(P)/FAD-dependent oxidoreductase [Candidatus Physcosoma equi]